MVDVRVREVENLTAELDRVKTLGAGFKAGVIESWEPSDKHWIVEYHDKLGDKLPNPTPSGLGWVVVKYPSEEASLVLTVYAQKLTGNSIPKIIIDKCREEWPEITVQNAVLYGPLS